MYTYLLMLVTNRYKCTSPDKFKDNNAEPWTIVADGSDRIGFDYVEQLYFLIVF